MALQPPVMVCPAGRVKTRFQPLMAVLPVLVIVMLLVRPVFHALTAEPRLVAGDALADDRGAEPGPGRGLADQFHENVVATIGAEHGTDGFGERGDEPRHDSGRVLPGIFSKPDCGSRSMSTSTAGTRH